MKGKGDFMAVVSLGPNGSWMSVPFILAAPANVDPFSLDVSNKSKVEFDDLDERTRGQASTSLRSTFICRDQPLALIRHFR